MCYVKVTHLTGKRRTFAGVQNQQVLLVLLNEFMQLYSRMKAIYDFLDWIEDFFPLVLIAIVNIQFIIRSAAGNSRWIEYGYIASSNVLFFFYHRRKRMFAGVLDQMFQHVMLHISPWIYFLDWLIVDFFPLVWIMIENVQLIIRSAAGSLRWMEYGYIISFFFFHRIMRTAFAGVQNQMFQFAEVLNQMFQFAGLPVIDVQMFPDVMFRRLPWMDFLAWLLELFSLVMITIATVLLMIDSEAIIESLGWMGYITSHHKHR